MRQNRSTRSKRENRRYAGSAPWLLLPEPGSGRRSWRPQAGEIQLGPTAMKSPRLKEFAMWIRLPFQSSNRYSPKSHAAVKNTTSNDVKNVSHTKDNSE